MGGDPSGDGDEAVVRTFLFADLRGYTRYTGHFGDEAATELTTRFAEIAKTTVTPLGGRVVETRGDEIRSHA